jgi:hypothetical protein
MRRDLEHALHRRWAAHQHEPPAFAEQPLAGEQDRAQARRVQEQQIPQVQRDHVLGDALERRFQLGGREHVELAPERDQRDGSERRQVELEPRHQRASVNPWRAGEDPEHGQASSRRLLRPRHHAQAGRAWVRVLRR